MLLMLPAFLDGNGMQHVHSAVLMSALQGRVEVLNVDGQLSA